jgi:hypothetical protein
LNYILRQVEAFLGISPDSVILVQDNLHRDILFLTATKSVIGWTALQNSIRIFFHQVTRVTGCVVGSKNSAPALVMLGPSYLACLRKM